MADKNGFSNGDEVEVKEGFFKGVIGNLMNELPDDKYIIKFGDCRFEIVHKDNIKLIEYTYVEPTEDL